MTRRKEFWTTSGTVERGITRKIIYVALGRGPEQQDLEHGPTLN